MATNKIIKIDEDVEVDNDSTAELEMLTESHIAAIEEEMRLEQEAESLQVDPAKFGELPKDSEESRLELNADLELRSEIITALQSEIDHLRSEALEANQKTQQLKAAGDRIAKELEEATKNNIEMTALLNQRDAEISALRTTVAKEETLQSTGNGHSGDSWIGSVRQFFSGSRNSGHRTTEFGITEQAAARLKAEIDARDVRIGALQAEITALQTHRSSHAEQTVIRPPDSQQQYEFDRGEMRALVEQGERAADEYPVRPGQMSLGSDADNDIQIECRFVSRHHAQIFSTARESVLKDINSTNGTYVNSRKIRKCTLHDGDSISIGKLRFRFVRQRVPDQDDRQIGQRPASYDEESHHAT